jgi:hypothetical protein
MILIEFILSMIVKFWSSFMVRLLSSIDRYYLLDFISMSSTFIELFHNLYYNFYKIQIGKCIGLLIIYQWRLIWYLHLTPLPPFLHKKIPKIKAVATLPIFQIHLNLNLQKCMNHWTPFYKIIQIYNFILSKV